MKKDTRKIAEASLYELSGLKKAFDEVDKIKEEEKKKKEDEFWKDINNQNEIDPFWLT